jgi:hypothetical protein
MTECSSTYMRNFHSYSSTVEFGRKALRKLPNRWKAPFELPRGHVRRLAVEVTILDTTFYQNSKLPQGICRQPPSNFLTSLYFALCLYLTLPSGSQPDCHGHGSPLGTFRQHFCLSKTRSKGKSMSHVAVCQP